MIRLSETADREGLAILWQEAFGDEWDAIQLFLDGRYKPQNTLVSEDNGKITSMLFLLEGKLKVKNNVLNAYYLYAAATMKESRGKGIMAQMLDAAKTLASNRGIDLICLKPAEDSLYGFYQKHGYKTVFKTKKVSIKVSDASDINNKSECTDVFIAREKAFKNSDRFIWDEDAIKFAIKQHKHYGGKVCSDCNGYCLYNIDNGTCCVKEMCFTTDSVNAVLNSIAVSEGVNEFKLELPVNYPVIADEIAEINNGMALFISDKADVLENADSIYLNLTLD